MREHQRASASTGRRCGRRRPRSPSAGRARSRARLHTLPSSEHLRAAPLLGTHRLSTFRGKDVQPPSSAASFSFRATPQGFFRKEAHLVPELVGPAAGQQEMIYLLTGGGACRFGLTPVSSPLPTFLLMLPATPPCLNARPPLVEVALSPDFSTGMCGIFPLDRCLDRPQPEHGCCRLSSPK